MSDTFRETIKVFLRQLQQGLGNFEQTTHGSFVLGGCGIEQVADRLVKVWHEPTSYNISELDQSIDGFFKAKQ